MQSIMDKKVVIMYLLWDEEPKRYVEDAIEGMKKQTYSRENMEFLIVYNNHKPEHESQAPYISGILERHKDEIPHTTFLPQKTNLGFSGGNNLGMQWAIDNGFDYVFLHNGDGYLGERCIEEMVKGMESDESIGASQSLVLLHPETDLVNTAGNCLHYLGLGYCDQYRVSKNDIDLPEIKDVGYLSGAAVMMRTDLLKQYGLWDGDYFMYHEDTDYSLRLRIHGYRTVMVRDAEFFHKYQFSKSIQKYYWMERNRQVILLLFFKWRTLLLMFPMWFALEIGLFFFSLGRGWFKERIRVYQYWMKSSNWTSWLMKRKEIKRTRTVTDRELLRQMVSTVAFQEAEVESLLLRFFGNPLMWLYGKFLRAVIWW
jgi:GT2 family glycosyltransferase